jgi:hypothetical protein
MLASLKSALGNAWERVYDSDTNVFLANIAIIVGKYFEDMIGVLAEAVKELKNTVLVIILGVSWVENSKEEVVYEDADGLLEMLSEVQE